MSRKTIFKLSCKHYYLSYYFLFQPCLSFVDTNEFVKVKEEFDVDEDSSFTAAEVYVCVYVILCCYYVKKISQITDAHECFQIYDNVQ